MAASIWLQFDDTSTPLELRDAEELQLGLPAILSSWAFKKFCNHPPGAKQPIVISSQNGEYVMQSRWLDKPVRRKDPVDTICALIIELIWAWLEDHPGKLCLHGAAAEFAGRLVIFPNQYQAGKSLLSGCLAAGGQRIYTDDILPIETSSSDGVMRGVATGVAPRLRLPLPENLSSDQREFLDGHKGPQSARYRYLVLDDSQQARRNEELPVGAFVLLERDETCEPALEPVRESEMLASVVWQNFARNMPSGSILHCLKSLVSATGCYKLRYSTPAQAVDILQEQFSSWHNPLPIIQPRITAHQPETVPTSASPEPEAFRQSPGVFEHASGDEHFLADGDGVAIHHLNPMASAIWRLLVEPMTRQQLIEILHSAFPGEAVERLGADLDDLLGILSAKQLLLYTGSINTDPLGQAK